MTGDPIAFWSFVFTVLGVVIAGGGFVLAIKTLKENTEVARAQFWVMFREVLANYDDVQASLRPGGIWAPKEGEILISRGLL